LAGSWLTSAEMYSGQRSFIAARVRLSMISPDFLNPL
jgi:hypothetical protein